jgi:glycosyltransferase involved in cell wall biosynthesis
VDDGSSDNTFAAAKAYESAQLNLVRQENLGAAAARDTAVSEAQGDFIQYLDADDPLSANKVEEQVILLQSNPGYLAESPALYFFDGENPDSGLEKRSGAVYSDDPVQWLIEPLGPDGPFGMVPYGALLTPRARRPMGRWSPFSR